MFLGKTLYSHRASSPTQVYKWVPGNLMLRANPTMDQHLMQGGGGGGGGGSVEILLVASCHENRRYALV